MHAIFLHLGHITPGAVLRHSLTQELLQLFQSRDTGATLVMSAPLAIAARSVPVKVCVG
jgi:hypothetical protein